MRKGTIALALLLLPGVTQAKTLEELLVEKGVITRSEMRASRHAGDGKVYYDGGTRLDFADQGFTAKINTQLQARYEFTDNDSDVDADDKSSFSVKRARLQIAGSALHEEFSYKLQVDFVGDEGEDGARETDLRDAFIEWHACDWGAVRMGQFKTQISRQFNTSSVKLQFADRSEVSEHYDLDRQQGLAGYASLADDRIVLSAGIFNGRSDGEGRNRAGVDTKHTGVVSARVDVLGEMNEFEEGDINMTDELALNIGGAYAYSDAENDVGAGLEGTELQTASVDANLKVAGFALHAEVFWQDFESDDSGVETDNVGFYAQAGYFLLPKRLELAARYGYLDCDDGRAPGICAGNDNVNEVAASLNYYWWKHSLKAQLGWAFTNEDAHAGDEDINTNRWLLQLSSWF